MSPGPKPTSVSRDILINPAVWLQSTWAENWGSCCGLHGAKAYLNTKWYLDPSNRLATIHQRYRQTEQTTVRFTIGRPKTHHYRWWRSVVVTTSFNNTNVQRSANKRVDYIRYSAHWWCTNRPRGHSNTSLASLATNIQQHRFHLNNENLTNAKVRYTLSVSTGRVHGDWTRSVNTAVKNDTRVHGP